MKQAVRFDEIVKQIDSLRTSQNLLAGKTITRPETGTLFQYARQIKLHDR